MAAPLPTRKQSVDLASPAVRGSRIRRDPPPKVKEAIVLDPEDRDRREVVLGVVIFALALFVIVAAVASYNGWSPRQYTAHL